MHFALAVAIALNFWGTRGVDIPCQPVAVSGADALVPVDVFGFPYPMSVDGCRILISSVGTQLRKDGQAWYCADVVHEVGHIGGLGHSERGLMAPELLPEFIPYWCDHWRTFARRHGVPISRPRSRPS